MPSGFEFLRASERRGLIKRIEFWNKGIEGLRKIHGSAAGLPGTLSLADAEKMIVNRETYEDIVEMLDRFQDQRGWQVDPNTGNIRFLDQELRKAVDQVKKMRKDARMEAYPEWDLLAPFHQIEAMASGNIAPVTGKYDRPEDLATLKKWYASEQLETYISNYLIAVSDYMEPIYDIVKNALFNIVSLAGDRYLKAIFDRGYIETQIEYVYPPQGSAYLNIPEAKRMKDVREFWVDQEHIARTNATAGRELVVDEYSYDYKIRRKLKSGGMSEQSRTSVRTSATWL